MKRENFSKNTNQSNPGMYNKNNAPSSKIFPMNGRKPDSILKINQE